jgi:iron complex outermembrane receptor protein
LNIRNKLVVAGTLFTLALPLAYGQEVVQDGSSEGLQEIVVTAQRRAENQQSVPITVSAVDASTLQSANIISALDLNQMTPSVNLAAGNGTVTPFLRGYGNGIQTAGNEASVPIYFDGVYYSRLTPGMFSLNSIERIETLAGPQGTLFGRNASGGVVQIVTRDPVPGEAASVQASVSYSNFDTISYNAYLASGIGDRVASDVALVYHNEAAGWGTNIFNGDPTYTDRSFDLRSKTIAELGESTKATLILNYGNGSTELGQFGQFFGHLQGYPDGSGPLPRLGFFDLNNNDPMYDTSENWGAVLRLSQQLPSAVLTNTVAYRDERDTDVLDDDASPQPYLFASLPSVSKQLSDELQLASTGHGRLQYTVGLYYLNLDAKYDPILFSGSSFGSGNQFLFYSEGKSDSYAGYGQATFDLTSRLRLTAGGRYSVDDLHGSGETVLAAAGARTSLGEQSAANNYDRFNYKTSLDYQLQQDLMIYASVSTGYKAATYNLLPFHPTPAMPETLTAFEVGAKSEWLDRRLRLNGSLFYYDITDSQVVTATPFGSNVGNAPKARAMGADIDAIAQVTHGWTVHAAISALDNQYTDYKDAPFTSPNPLPPYGNLATVPGNATGNQMPLAPRFTFVVGSQYTRQTDIGTWGASLNYYHNSGLFFDPQNRLLQPAYGLLSAQMSYAPLSGNLKIRAFGNNLTNTHYYLNGTSQSGNAGDLGYPAAPRTYGVAVDFSLR